MLYSTILIPESREDYERLLKICHEISVKDASFKFKTHEGRILVFSQSHTQAHQRGTWLVKKTGVKASYIVPEKKKL
jgi:hypothetical protein